ncbi:YgaP family membrane protein [Primorskyibacter sp. S87]|uniref:YgaP family membrane protein n=1 Tax=Primorskyibacter sp. S87 TaxID=3415126 RepID=UPI003C7B1EE3
MLTRNMGQTDRVIRTIIGIALIALAFAALSGGWAWLAGIVGAVMLATAAMGNCPPYAILGINTCNTK